MYNNISLPCRPAERPSGHGFAYAFSLHGLLQWKHIPVMPRCHSLFRFLITNSVTSAGPGLLARRSSRRLVRGQDLPAPAPSAASVGNVHGECPWGMSMGSVYGGCPWAVSMGNVHGKSHPSRGTGSPRHQSSAMAHQWPLS